MDHLSDLDAMLISLALLLLVCLIAPRIGATIEQLFEDLW